MGGGISLPGVLGKGEEAWAGGDHMVASELEQQANVVDMPRMVECIQGWSKGGGQGGRGGSGSQGEGRVGSEGRWAGGGLLGVETPDKMVRVGAVIRLLNPLIRANSGAAGSQKELGEGQRGGRRDQRGRGVRQGDRGQN